jgi:phenylalanyl-tRNA synthetase beta chain
VLEGLQVGPSPRWLLRRLEAAGLRSVNNVVDVTNYVLLELGQPLHAFDLDALRGEPIRVGKAQVLGEHLRTLDGAQRRLPPDAIVIADAQGPVALGGVMGGADSEVGPETTRVLLEAAWFDPVSIRRTSRTLGLRTESSYRFERGVDITAIPQALDRAAGLILELAGGSLSGAADAYPMPHEPRSIQVNPQAIRRLLGAEVPLEDVVELLRRLNLEPQERAGFITVKVPPYRADLQRPQDVAEEVARLWGYHRIPSRLPCAALSPQGLTERQKVLRSVRQYMLSAGFSEAINYSFMSPESLDTLGLPETDERRRAVVLLNPLRKEESLLRTTLVPSLLQNLKHNLQRDVKDLRLFELARCFRPRGESLPEEPWMLAAVMSHDRAYHFWKEPCEEFYLLKGILEGLLQGLRISGWGFKPSAEPFLHPGKAADLLVKDEKVGYLGVLNPGVAEALELRGRQEVLLLELSLQALVAHLPPRPQFKPLPRYPAVQRDVAVVVEQTLPAEAVVEAARGFPSELLEEVRLFDLYGGPGIPQGKKSLGLSIRYRSAERTLTEEEVEELHQRLLQHLLKSTGGTLRA